VNKPPSGGFFAPDSAPANASHFIGRGRKCENCGAKPELRSKKKRPASLQAASILVLMGGIEPSTY